MSEILFLLAGLVVGVVGLVVWARYNKQKAIDLLNTDFEAEFNKLKDQFEGELKEKVDELENKVDELKDKVEEEFGDLEQDVKDKLKELLDSLKG